MAARILAFYIHKGGTGKSTIAQQLAAVYASRKMKVLVIDGDETNSSIKFFNNRNLVIESGERPDMNFIKCEYHKPETNIRQILKQSVDMYDIIIIDAAGSRSNLFITSIQLCDVIVVPVNTSRKSFDQIAPTFAVIDEVDRNIRAVTDWDDYETDARIVLNEVKRTSISFRQALEVKEKLASEINFVKTIIPVIEKLNNFYEEDNGLALMDIKNPKRAVFELLADELLQDRSIYENSEDA